MKIFVIKHGITQMNKKKIVNGEIDEPLAPEGNEQVKAAIPLLPATIKHIYSSPMLRTRQTAEIINTKLHLPLSIHEELTEVRMGTLAGKSWIEMKSGEILKKKHRTIQYDYKAQGGESADEVTTRVTAFLRSIYGKHQHDEVLVVTHGGIIRLLSFLESGTPLTNEIDPISPYTFDFDAILKLNTSETML